ncbi:methyltransferase family protein [Herbihabitans rhizosphaerae]|uniref:Methyltransferase family protein n=1 Tax=Herbihabitans rhizosphaerae TaxID=1872711 RepID=A0A4Q7L474_9PSEU|nr:class I SAM-dependent methyltransferase [Herbihabitans rhizosphaerae]RZS43580.1 methyltransferase family protein [Herbihabitans rhizosphaerae]
MAHQHPIFARVYPALSRAAERGGMTEHRQRLLAGLTGEVIEIGAGNGLNFRHYPPTVTRVVAVEPEHRLRRLAEIAAERAPVPVEVVAGLAEHLPTADASLDAAVVSLVLCSINDPGAALREIRRVLKTGGQLRFLEHVRADTRGIARTQRILDATIWPHLAGGCHTGRDTTATINESGFTIESIDRFWLGNARTPFTRHILGTATPVPREPDHSAG